jgi:hypothetical protein
VTPPIPSTRPARRDRKRLEALEISGTHWAGFGFRSYRSVDRSECDLCAGPLEEERWDVVLLEQVLEHVL